MMDTRFRLLLATARNGRGANEVIE